MSWHHLEDRTPKARKAHRCELCDLPIEIGERHVMRCGISEGVYFRFRMHTLCERVPADELWDEADWECLDPAEFRERLEMRKLKAESACL